MAPVATTTRAHTHAATSASSEHHSRRGTHSGHGRCTYHGWLLVRLAKRGTCPPAPPSDTPHRQHTRPHAHHTATNVEAPNNSRASTSMLFFSHHTKTRAACAVKRARNGAGLNRKNAITKAKSHTALSRWWQAVMQAIQLESTQHMRLVHVNSRRILTKRGSDGGLLHHFVGSLISERTHDQQILTAGGIRRLLTAVACYPIATPVL